MRLANSPVTIVFTDYKMDVNAKLEYNFNVRAIATELQDLSVNDRSQIVYNLVTAAATFPILLLHYQL